jgi:hypothetical protein
MSRRRTDVATKVKTRLPRLVELDCGYAVDVDGLTMVIKRDGARWLITIDDAAQLAYWCDDAGVCHLTVEPEQRKVA